MKKRVIVSALIGAAWATAAASGQAFTPGNLVVLQAGADGGPTTLSSAATPLFLKEIDITDGHVVQTIAVPSSGTSSVTQSGSATSEGMMSLSADGKRLVFVGYRADAGTLSVVSTSSATNPRVVAVVDCSGSIDTTTALGDAYTGNNIRSAVSSNGTDIWTAGTAANPQGGVRYATLGATTSVFLNDNGAGGANTPTNCRVVNIFQGQLYASSASGAFLGVGTVGSGMPTTTGQTLTLLSGFPTTGGTTAESAYDYYFADADTVYVCDDNSIATTGGVQKWTQSGGVWTKQYTLSSGLASGAGARHIAGKTVGGTTTLWITTAATSANGIVSVVDTGAGSSFSAFGSNTGANTWWRGIDFAPSGCSTSNPCYANCDNSTVSPILNANDFQCFLNHFAAADAYANCDGSTVNPVLNANDFQCFLNKFAAGCT